MSRSAGIPTSIHELAEGALREHDGAPLLGKNSYLKAGWTFTLPVDSMLSILVGGEGRAGSGPGQAGTAGQNGDGNTTMGIGGMDGNGGTTYQIANPALAPIIRRTINLLSSLQTP